ncbi:hypothetical protein GN956_G20991 [Arapaima gigas]
MPPGRGAAGAPPEELRRDEDFAAREKAQNSRPLPLPVRKHIPALDARASAVTQRRGKSRRVSPLVC